MYKTISNENTEYGYGLGLYAASKIANCLVYGHAGGGYGYQTNMMWVPEKKIGVVVLSNNMKDSQVGSIAQKALKLIIERTEKQESVKDLRKPKFEEIPSSLLKRLEGTYCAENNLTSQLFRISFENNKLFYCEMNGNRLELYPISSTKFTTKKERFLTFELDQKEKPTKVHVDDLLFPYEYKYNDGPKDKEGPNLMEWKEFVGIYEFEDEAKPNYLGISIENGYLYLIFNNKLRLRHHKENLFFTADGEALILAKNDLIFKGIKAKRIDFDMKQFLQDFAKSKIRSDYYYLAVSSLANILNTLQGIQVSMVFLTNVIGIDEEFSSSFINFGKKLYALGKLNDSRTCFAKVLEMLPNNSDAKKMVKITENSHN
jgi:hypothetical protein